MTKIVEWTERRPLPKIQQSELVASSWVHSCALNVVYKTNSSGDTLYSYAKCSVVSLN